LALNTEAKDEASCTRDTLVEPPFETVCPDRISPRAQLMINFIA